MKRILFLLLNVLFFYSSQCQELSSLYRPFQRDIIFLIDWESELESLSYIFHLSGANLDRGLGSVAMKLAAALYNPVVPIVCSATTWRTLLERAQFIEDAQKLSSAEFVKKYIEKYKNRPDYRQTLLLSSSFLEKLHRLCKKSLEVYQQVNAAIAQEAAKSSDFNTVVYRVGRRFVDATLGGMLTTDQDMKLWKGVSELLKCYIIVEKVKKERDDWIFRKASECVYIMIPKAYLNGIKNQVNAFAKKIKMPKSVDEVLSNSMKDAQKNRSLTVDEIILGIKFENFEAKIDPFAIPLTACSEKGGSALSDSFIKKTGKKSFGGILTNIIINRKDLKTFSEEKYLIRAQPAWVPHYCVWNVYGLGHGSAPAVEEAHKEKHFYVMGLRENAIVAFLEFFDSINTRFMYYTSCYAAGHRLRTLFLENQRDGILKKKFNYTLVIGAITQVVTYGLWYPLTMPPYELRGNVLFGLTDAQIDTRQKKLVPTFYGKFGRFFNDLHILTRNGKAISYKEILTYVDDFSSPHFYSNIPQIRFAGSAWFNVIDLGEKILRLTPTYVRTKEAEIKAAADPAKKALILKNREVILVDAESIWQTLAGPAHSEIPFPIKIEGQMPTFISMVTGNAWHAFEKIDASSFGLIEVINKFSGVEGTFYARTYFIKELKVRNDLAASQQAELGAAKIPHLILRDVYLFTNAPDPRSPRKSAHQSGILFNFNGKFYAAVYSQQDAGQVMNARNSFLQSKMPNLQNIPQPPTYASLIKTFFPGEKVVEPVSLEPIAHQIELIAKYKQKQKEGKKPLELWKKLLSGGDAKIIESYEAAQKAALAPTPTPEQPTPPLRSMQNSLAQLEVELRLVRNAMA